MNKDLLFAVDPKTNEIIVSSSPKGSMNIAFVERIGRNENELLYNAVITLTCISKVPNMDAAIFKAMDKVCQLVYANHKASV